MIQLIINADDFGLHPLVNQGIIKGFTEGCLTSTSLLASGEAFDEAVALAKENAQLGIGIHTAIVGGLKPVSNPKDVSSLLVDGHFPETYGEVVKRIVSGQIDFNELYTELDNQFRKIIDTGLPITHVDGHQHLHVLPEFLPMVISLCKKYKVHAIRLPGEFYPFLNGVHSFKRLIGKIGLSNCAERSRQLTTSAGLWSTTFFWGMMAGGQMDQVHMNQILNEVGKSTGSHEIMMHPGLDTTELSNHFTWGYHWQDELATLCSWETKQQILAKGIKLINYGNLYE